MKKSLIAAGFFLTLAAEIIALVVFAVSKPDVAQDAVEVNEIVKSVTADFDSMSTHKHTSSVDYVVLNDGGTVLYATRSGLSESVNAAIVHRDTVLDVVKDGETVGKVIIYNDAEHVFYSQKLTVVWVLIAAIVAECAICILYAVYLHSAIVKPFGKLKGFAERIACGNLDIPLEMDRNNLFGAFTESFDIMRSELKKARIAQAQAEQSKKELVAKLSHDIKTPVASIKAVSEVGLAVAESEKDRSNYAQIIGKADQINTLVTNLFTASLEELQQLAVNPVYIESRRVKDLLLNSDYLRRATFPELPDCLIYADPLRLQQVFDNVFANSYKYANTQITVGINTDGDCMNVIIEDSGGGVHADELPFLKEKFRRGSNADGIEGAGLGLYISDYFMAEMHGGLIIENGEHGLKITVSLRLAVGESNP